MSTQPWYSAVNLFQGFAGAAAGGIVGALVARYTVRGQRRSERLGAREARREVAAIEVYELLIELQEVLQKYRWTWAARDGDARRDAWVSSVSLRVAELKQLRVKATPALGRVLELRIFAPYATATVADLRLIVHGDAPGPEEVDRILLATVSALGDLERYLDSPVEVLDEMTRRQRRVDRRARWKKTWDRWYGPPTTSTEPPIKPRALDKSAPEHPPYSSDGTNE